MAGVPMPYGYSVYYKELASSSTNVSYDQCLTALQTEWNKLTNAQKSQTRIRRGNSIYNISSRAGLFTMITTSSSGMPNATVCDIVNAKFYNGDINGAVLSDLSSNNNSTALTLEILTCD